MCRVFCLKCLQGLPASEPVTYTLIRPLILIADHSINPPVFSLLCVSTSKAVLFIKIFFIPSIAVIADDAEQQSGIIAHDPQS